MAEDFLDVDVSMGEQQAENILMETGSSGLNRFGGWIYEEWLKDLYGIRGIRIYKEMRDNDPIVGAVLFAIKMLIRQVPWRIDPASDNSADKEAAEFLDSCRHDMSMSWDDLIIEILSMLVFGWSYHEIVYKRRLGDKAEVKSKFNDGRIGWRKLPIRAQETFFRWIFDADGGIQGLEQIPPPDYRLRFIPIEKALLFRTETHKNNPEGRSILRNAYRPWYFKKNIEEIEGIGIERDLAGLPVAEVPPNILSPTANEQERALLQQIKTIVTNLRRDEMEGVVFPAENVSSPNGGSTPTGYKLSLMSTGSRRQFDTTAIKKGYAQEIAMTVMADFIMLGHEGVGSFALSDSKTNLFSLAIAAILKSITEVFNSYAIPRLFALNSFSGITELPKLAFGDIETPDLEALGTYIANTVNSGAIMPDDQLENYLRTAANLPERTETMGVEKVKKNKQSKVKKAALRRPPEQTAQIIDFREAFKAKIEKQLSEIGRMFSDYTVRFEEPDALLDSLKEYEFVGSSFQEDIGTEINRMYHLGWDGGKEMLGDSVREVELTLPENYAADYAKDRAAELVTQIDEATRDMLRETIESSVKQGETYMELSERLQNSFAFSADRADRIARTESGTSYNVGAVQCWQDSGLVDSVYVEDGDGDDECAAANGSTWSFDEAIANPLGHVNCSREFFPVLSDNPKEENED